MLTKVWKRLFPAARPRPTPTGDRRARERHIVARETCCEVISLQVILPVRVMVWDISEEGLSLFCDKILEPGTFLAINLLVTRGATRLIRGRVVHVTRFRGRWLVGCAFVDQLRPDEVEALL